MEPISNADRLVALLRIKLQERSKSQAATSRKKAARDPAEPNPIRGLVPAEDMDDQQLRRSFIQNLLADQLGPSLINDGQFQQIVSRVTQSIDDDPDASRLLSRVIADLRTS